MGTEGGAAPAGGGGGGPAAAMVALPILALTLGHVFSNAVRTLPAVAADVLSAGLGVSAEGLAAVTGAFSASFALTMIPTGVALDRWGVRRTALALLAINLVGAALAALAGGPAGMLLAQIVLGVGCSGMLMCPVTYAARILPAGRFALWSGVIQAFGNTGMLLSASPFALLVEWRGWQAGFWAAAGIAALALAAVALFVREPPLPRRSAHRTLWQDTQEVVALALSPALRPLMVFVFASVAAVLGVRGLWGGPWLMEAKGLGRVEAGNLLLLCTAALTVGPALAGVVDRLLGHRAALLAGSHALVAALILLMVAGGPGGLLASLLGVPALPPSFDAALLAAFGLVVSFQVLVFPMTRAMVPPEQTGRALSAVNMSFFGGAAVLQAVSGFAASLGGVSAALCSFAAALLVCTGGFLLLRRRDARRAAEAR